jgi:hypothetical protein
MKKYFFKSLLGTSVVVGLTIALPASAMYQPVPNGSAQQRPLNPSMNMGPMPMPSPEEFEKALAEIDNFFKNMSDEEMQDFMNFLQDVETGKVKLDDLLPPGTELPFGPPPQQPTKETKPLEPEHAPVAEPAPKKIFRDRTSTQQMLAQLIEYLTSLRHKASVARKVAETLAPLNHSLDTLIYYLHIISKPEHVDQLISDTELLPVHDMLQELAKVLKKYESQITVPDPGEPEDPIVKERSKFAFSTVVQSLNYAFKQQQLLAGLEKLLKKYEPEALKKRQEREAIENRARQEAEQMKSWQPRSSYIKKEIEYGSRGRPTRFMDHHYTERHGHHHESGRPFYGNAYEGKPTLASREIKKAQPRTVTEQPKQKTEGLAAQPHDLPTPTLASYKPSFVPSNKEEHDVEKLLRQITTDLDYATVLDDSLTSFKAYLDDQSSFDKARQEKAQSINEALQEVTTALQRIGRQQGILETKLKKLPRARQQQARTNLENILKTKQKPLQELYEIMITTLKKIDKAAQDRSSMPISTSLLYAHFGYQNLGGKPNDQTIQRNPHAVHYGDEFMQAYEVVFKQQYQEERREISKTLVERDKSLEEPEQPVMPESATLPNV